MGVDGHRADLIMMKAAKTIAAYNGRQEVTEGDIQQAVQLALVHRMRRKPFQDINVDKDKLDGVLNDFTHSHSHNHTYSHNHDHDHEAK